MTLRVRVDVPSLRTVAFVREFRRSLAEGCERGAFRVNHYSLQGDHAHLIVEAYGKDALTIRPEVARPHTWLLRIGWRRHGLVDPA